MPPEHRARMARVRPWETLKATAKVKTLWRAPPGRMGGGGGACDVLGRAVGGGTAYRIGCVSMIT